MAATRTQGITVDSNGNLIIDKEHRGVRIYLRLGPLSQEDAEFRLDAEITRVESGSDHKAASHPRFADCAARYLAESQHKRGVSLVAWHIRLLYPYLANLEVNHVHDRTMGTVYRGPVGCRRKRYHDQSQPRGGANDPESCGAGLSR
jgi:hypothetical protein